MFSIINLKAHVINQQLVCILLFIILKLKNVDASQVIYNPLPIIDIDTQKYGRYIQSTTVIEDYPQVLVSVFLQESLALFDLSQNCQLLAIYNHTVQQAISRNSFLYFITQDKQMIIQQFIPASQPNVNDNQHQYLINVNIYQNTQYAFNSIYVDGNQKYLYIGCFGYLIILDVSNKLNIQEIAFVSITHDFTYWITLIEDQYLLLSNYYSNILIYDISNIQMPTLFRRLDQVGSESVQTYYFSKEQILYSISFYYSLQITDLSLLFQNKAQFQTMDEQQNTQGTFNIQSSYVINSMYVSQDLNYLFLTIRSNGFLIYDISTRQFKMSPSFLINVNSFGFSTFIQTAGINDRYVIFSEGISLKIYEKTIPNTSQTIINIFNLDQCIFVNSFKEMWPWSILYIENKYLVVTAGYTGFQIYDMSIPLMPQQTFKDKRENTSYDSSLYLAKRKILLIGQSEKGIAFYNTTLSYSQPTFILSKIYSANPDTDSFVSNADENILAFVDEKSFGFIDLNDIQNTFVIDQVQLPPNESRSLEGIAMDENFQYGCSALRNRGIFYFKFDVSEDGKNQGKKIKVINFIELYGAESVVYDKRNNGIFYVADGVSGVTVLDSSDKSKQIQLVSTNTVLGWAGKVFQPDGNLNILIVNHHDRGSISVMDISNLSQIQKIQEMQFIPYGSFASVTDLQNNFLAITVQNGFRVCQTNSPINLHAQMKRSKDQQSSTNLIDMFNPFIQNQKTNNQIVAKIGESVSFTVVPLNYFKGVQYKSLLLYEFQIKQIPSWITFQPFSQTINMIPQNSITSPNQGFCILLLDIYLQIYSSDFVSQKYNITKDQSTSLYNYFIDQGVLSQDGYLRSTYDPSVRLLIEWEYIYRNNDKPSTEDLQNIYDFVKLTIDRSTFYYPIFIRILQSLNLNLTNEQGMVETYSSQVTVQLTLVYSDLDPTNQSNQPQFLPQTYNGVLSDLKSQNLQLDLRGIVTSVNNILKDQIYIYLPKSIEGEVYIQLNIRDEINADMQQTIKLSKIPQFKIKASLSVLQSIQEQYDQQYPGGLYVEQAFQINIDQNSLKSEEFLQVKYQAQISEEIWRSLSSSGWIQFENTGQAIKLTGKGSLSDWQKSFTLQITATDGYEYNTQNLVIKFSQIPLTIILLYVGYLLIIIFFFFFFYCIRQKIHHRFFSTYFKRKLEKIYYKNQYFKKIYLMKDFHAISSKLIYLLKRDYIQKNKKNLSYFQQIKSQNQKSPKRSNSISHHNNVKYTEMLFLQQYIDDQGLPNMNKIILDVLNIYKQNISKFHKLNSSEFNQTNSRLYLAIRSIFTLRILETDKQTQEIFQILKKSLKQKTQNALDWYQQLVEIQSDQVQNKKHHLSKKSQLQIKQLSEDTKLTTQNNQNKQQLEDNLKGQNLSLNNETNISLTQPSQQLIHNKTQSNLSYQPSDVFLIPEIKINEEALQSEISQIYKKYDEQALKLLIQNESGSFYNFQLLKNTILSEFYGFGQEYKPKRFKPSYGSVIHLSQNQIKDIKIFQKDCEQDQQQNSIFKQICNKIKAVLFLNYKKIGQNFHSAQNIRNWLRYQINENYIILQGEPQKLNLGEYLIQILNSDKYVAYEYSLQVVLNKQEAAAYASSQIKQKSKKIKELKQSKNLQKSGAYQKQSVFLQSQERIEPYNHENQIQEEQQSNNILKIIQLKIPQNSYFSEVRLQKTEEMNNSSILSYHFNKNNKKEDDLESSHSTFEVQKRFSFDKSYAQMIPQFGENTRKQESINMNL